MISSSSLWFTLEFFSTAQAFIWIQCLYNQNTACTRTCALLCTVHVHVHVFYYVQYMHVLGSDHTCTFTYTHELVVPEIIHVYTVSYILSLVVHTACPNSVNAAIHVVLSLTMLVLLSMTTLLVTCHQTQCPLGM